AAKELPALRAATADLSWLLSHGYAEQSALKLVGDRHELTVRQRQAVSRCACSDAARDRRLARRITRDEFLARDPPTLAIDGFNCLITIESALSHGIVLRGRDGALRDLASVHGTYRQVAETAFAVEMLGRHLHGPREAQPPAPRTDTHTPPDPPPLAVTWFLDRPVANSGRLRALLLEIAERRGWPWTCELVNNPDAVLIRPEHPVVASSDAFILEHCARWFDPLGSLLAAGSPSASAAHVPTSGPVLAARPGLWLLDLGSPSPSSSGIGET
ncbi:MAG TPA: DUF434 domain-containing protein, partial [Nannocystis sp.]